MIFCDPIENEITLLLCAHTTCDCHIFCRLKPDIYEAKIAVQKPRHYTAQTQTDLLKTPFIQNTEHILQANKRDGIWSPSSVGNDMVRNLVVWWSNFHLRTWQRLKQNAPKRNCKAVVFFPDLKAKDCYDI